MRMLGDGPTADDASTTVPLLLVTPASAAAGGAMLQPAGGGGSASVYPDSNMVVILAALLCVLICALGLNSLLRCACAFHSGRNLAIGATSTSSAMMVSAPAASAGSGLDKRELRKMPVEYETNKAGSAPDTTECAICLGEFVDGEKVRLLPSCHHGFHVRCIDTWLAAHSSCPICRNSLFEEEDHGAAEA